MVSLKYLTITGSVALAVATPPSVGGQGQNNTYGCGEVNVFYTYAPMNPSHKLMDE